jgi:hypothetical protein
MDGKSYTRRDFMKVAGLGGLVFASGLPGCAGYGQPGSGKSDFHFVQLSDVHWGYNNPKVKSREPRDAAEGGCRGEQPRGQAGLHRLHR